MGGFRTLLGYLLSIGDLQVSMGADASGVENLTFGDDSWSDGVLGTTGVVFFIFDGCSFITLVARVLIIIGVSRNQRNI